MLTEIWSYAYIAIHNVEQQVRRRSGGFFLRKKKLGHNNQWISISLFTNYENFMSSAYEAEIGYFYEKK